VSGGLADRELAGDERFAILGRIGAGGMGVVDKALDKEPGAGPFARRLPGARAGRHRGGQRGFADAIAAFDAQGMLARPRGRSYGSVRATTTRFLPAALAS
jgi:hypothetical protein